MAPTSGKQFPVGLQYANVFMLNTNGRPAATSTTPYTGLEMEGAKTFSLNMPKARKVVHPGNNRALAVDFLPSQEGADGELRVSKHRLDVIAALTAVKTFTFGEATAVALLTDQQGNEPDVALHLYQQSLDGVTKVRRWRNILIPSSRCIPSVPGMSDNPEDVVFQIAINLVNNQMWGTALAALDEGTLEEGFIDFMTEKQARFVSFLADGAEDEFLLPVAEPAFATGKIAVWLNGVLTAPGAGLAVTTTKVTFTPAPDENDEIVLFYEKA